MADVNATLNERGARYGAFAGHAAISQGMKASMRNCPQWASLSPSQQEALEMIAHKIARALNGDPSYADTWHDIAGYATLVEQELAGGATSTLTAVVAQGPAPSPLGVPVFQPAGPAQSAPIVPSAPPASVGVPAAPPPPLPPKVPAAPQ